MSIMTQPMLAQPLTLQYADRETQTIAGARPAFKLLLMLSILSGLCVGACFLTFSQNPFAFILHVAVFATTIVLAVRASILLARLAPLVSTSSTPLQLTLDCSAGIGLTIIGLMPVAYLLFGQQSGTDQIGAGLLGIAYALLTLGATRHVMVYRMLANLCHSVDRPGMARGLIVLGWFKTIYECLWLGCCATALLSVAAKDVLGISNSESFAIYPAFAALIGSMGFAIIWIWMMIAHAQLLRLSR